MQIIDVLTSNVHWPLKTCKHRPPIQILQLLTSRLTSFWVSFWCWRRAKTFSSTGWRMTPAPTPSRQQTATSAFLVWPIAWLSFQYWFLVGNHNQASPWNMNWLCNLSKDTSICEKANKGKSCYWPNLAPHRLVRRILVTRTLSLSHTCSAPNDSWSS